MWGNHGHTAGIKSYDMIVIEGGQENAHNCRHSNNIAYEMLYEDALA